MILRNYRFKILIGLIDNFFNIELMKNFSMIDTITAIKTRRSIRKFKKEPISDEMITKIIECGMFAPSAGNEQPWHFIIIKDRDKLNKIPLIHEHAGMMPESAAGILVCFDPILEKHKQMAVQDCAAVTQNMLLTAHALGFGACWLGVYPRENRMKGLRELLNIPKSIVPFSLIAIGIPAEEKDEVNRYNINRVHQEKW